MREGEGGETFGLLVEGVGGRFMDIACLGYCDAWMVIEVAVFVESMFIPCISCSLYFSRWFIDSLSNLVVLLVHIPLTSMRWWSSHKLWMLILSLSLSNLITLSLLTKPDRSMLIMSTTSYHNRTCCITMFYRNRGWWRWRGVLFGLRSLG